MSNTSFSVKLQPLNLRPATLLEKKRQRYLPENYPRFSKSVFNKFGGIQFRPPILLKKSSSCEYIRILSASLERSKLTSVFGKTVGCALQCPNVVNHWYITVFFLKIFFLRQIVFRTYSEKNLWIGVLIAKLQYVQSRLATLLN